MQMTSVVVDNSFRNQLLPNIPPKVIIVMENAPYHSIQIKKLPNTSWRKVDIEDWLFKNGCQPRDILDKGQLLELAKKYRSEKKYVIDTITYEAGHRVVRLTFYHCQYNPIELIWARVKSYIAKKNNFKMADLKPLVKEVQLQVTPFNWASAVKHAEQLHADDVKLDRAVDHKIDSFTINISDQSSDDEWPDYDENTEAS